MGGKKVVHIKKLPMRQCTGCNERREKKDLIRIIRTPEEEIVVDFTGKKNGRGAYICNSVECLKLAQKKKSLERSLKTTIPEQVYQELLKEMSADEKG
jgi:hypothetical protein